MAISAAGIIFSSLNANTLSRLTADRSVAAIPFGCRYRLVDFCLSSMVNADISNINIVTNYKYRSLSEHIGSGKDWDLARRERSINIITPFQTASSGTVKVFSTHMEALISMKEYIEEFKEEYVVMMDSDNVLNIDLQELLSHHVKNEADITIVTKSLDESASYKHPRMMIASDGVKITDIAMSPSYNPDCPDLSLNIFVMSTAYLRNIIDECEAYNLNSLTRFMLKECKNANYRIYRYNDYVASVSSFLDYYKCSIELATVPAAREALLMKKDAPIFTRVHNSAPVVYKSTATVKNSLIADECIIEGTVIDSVIFRGVKVAKGAVVKNSVLFRGTYVESGAELNCIVTDKDVHVTAGVKLSGNENMPFYIQKGRKI